MTRITSIVATIAGEATVRPIVDATQMGQTTIGEVVFNLGARNRWHPRRP